MTYCIYFNNNFLISFSYPYKVKKVMFWSRIFEMEILMDLHVLRSPESENHIFSKWSVCICVGGECVFFYQHNSKTKCSRIFKFGILHLYHIQMLLETFHKDQTKTLCMGAHYFYKCISHFYQLEKTSFKHFHCFLKGFVVVLKNIKHEVCLFYNLHFNMNNKMNIKYVICFSLLLLQYLNTVKPR